MNARLIAVQAGDALKYSTTVNEVDRIGAAVLKVHKEAFANDAITSSRGKTIRRLVDDTFRRFFLGSTSELEWADTGRQFGVGTD
jgi:hypothetical protein